MHIAATVPTLLTVLAAASVPALNAPQRDADNDDVAVVFDVSSLSVSRSVSADRDLAVRMLPMMRTSQELYGNEADAPMDAVHALVSVFAEKYVDVSRIDVLPGGQVLVEGPAQAVERFGELVQFFENALHGSTEIEIVRFTRNARDLEGMIPRQQLLASLADCENVHRCVRSVHLDGQLEVYDLLSHTVSAAFSTEIAQGIAMHHVASSDLLTGFQLRATTSPAVGGVRLAYTVTQDEGRRDAPDQRVIADSKFFSDDKGVDDDTSAYWEEPFRVMGGTVAGELLLPPDRFAVFCTSVRPGRTEWCAIGLAEAPHAAAELTFADGASVVALPCGALRPPTLEVLSQLSECPRVPVAHSGNSVWLGAEDAAFSARVGFSHDDALSVAMDRVNVEAYHEFQGGSIVVLPPGARPLFDTAVALAAGPEPDQFHVAVTSNGGQQQHSASLFVTSGRTGAVLTGSERLVARRNAVEVAQHVGARQPDVEALFEGVALTLRVSKLADGRLAYVTFGQQSSNERLYPSTANSAGGGGLLALTAAHLGLDAQGTVKPGARGGWTIVLGDETGDGQSLTLEVREAR